MENFKNYLVVVNFEMIDGEETPIIEEMPLEEQDARKNYEWFDEDKTILIKTIPC